jgi:CRP-like cAMP-binding protein
LKLLPSFAVLTAAEASIYQRELAERSFAPGEEVRAGEDVLIVRDGSAALFAEGWGTPFPCGRLEAGDFLGEVELFEPEPLPMLARPASPLECYTVSRRALVGAFRYSRTGAVKFMSLFARGLSRKIRSANDRLQDSERKPEAAAADVDLRPTQLSEQDRQRLQALSVGRRLAAGDEVFAEGDASTELFVIGSGEVEIVKNAGGAPPITLARLGPGDFFGEMAFIDQGPRSAGAVARTEVELSVLPSGAVERLMEYHVGTAIYLANVICKIMSRRLTVTLRRLALG